MKGKISKPRIPGRRFELERLPQRRRNISVDDLVRFARSFHKAAKALAGSLLVGGNPASDVDFSPVVYLYRHALELHLKAIVLGGGGNFLEPTPDRLTIYKTHSVSWLAQFVSNQHWGVDPCLPGTGYSGAGRSSAAKDEGGYAEAPAAIPTVSF